MRTRAHPRWIGIECLECGEHRLVAGTHHFEAGACGRCGYLGWARPGDLQRPRLRSVVRRDTSGPRWTGALLMALALVLAGPRAAAASVPTQHALAVPLG